MPYQANYAPQRALPEARMPDQRSFDMGAIFNIQKFCINDGPGIRTTVFMKGCPLRCAWCHNPESQPLSPVLSYNAERCVGCGMCVAHCPNGCHTLDGGIHKFDRTNCVSCGACVNAGCKALELYGREATVENIIAEVLEDAPFYESSGGGMTLSGGEPLLQHEFAKELLTAAKENGIHTCMETSGYTTEEKIREIIPLVDLFLFDYKLTDDTLHKKYIGVSNERILKNLKIIDEAGGKTVLRCPIIPGINDTDDHFREIAEVANGLKNLVEINLEPYHSLGEDKYRNLGIPYTISADVPDKEQKQKWEELLSGYTDAKIKVQ